MRIPFVEIGKLKAEMERREHGRTIDEVVHPLDLGKMIPKLNGFTLVPENVAERRPGMKDFFGIVQSKIRYPKMAYKTPEELTKVVEHRVQLPATYVELKPEELEKLKEHLLSTDRLPKEVIAANLAKMQKQKSEIEKLEKMQRDHSDLIRTLYSSLFSEIRR